MGILTDLLINNSETEYKEFSKKLTPDTSYTILGVRIPLIKSLARKYSNDTKLVKSYFLQKHTYFEEYALHGFLIANLKCDVNQIITLTEQFLPFIDNWAICDTFCSALKVVKKNKATFFTKIKEWLKSPFPYTVRVALVLLLFHFNDVEWTDEIISLTKNINSNHYYVNMALAWLYSVLLIKNYEKAVKLLESKILPPFVQNKTIQKANESLRICQEKKIYLKTLKL